MPKRSGAFDASTVRCTQPPKPTGTPTHQHTHIEFSATTLHWGIQTRDAQAHFLPENEVGIGQNKCHFTQQPNV